MADGSGHNSDSCLYDYKHCIFKYNACQHDELHSDLRYNDASAAWVLIASIIVFFMKAGFMLVEVSFAKTVQQKRHVVVIKHQDAFASAFGFFLIGFDIISYYEPSQHIQDQYGYGVTDPMLWFFKFTFASNAATIVGGCLIRNRYKMRLIAAFISAFVISGCIHPIIARLIWSDDCHTLSPYRFCEFPHKRHSCGHDCTKNGLWERMYILDFAGGGAVHLVGGMAGLMLCIFAKIHACRNKEQIEREKDQIKLKMAGGEAIDQTNKGNFWIWMYPASGGEEESVSEAALGVIILWFCWFAFNCGSTESIELGRPVHLLSNSTMYPFYGIPSVIALNMVMSVATGGIVAILIASSAQWWFKAGSINANEIANGILSALVAITAGCPFMDYWGACLTGAIAVILYHIGCFVEYKFRIRDTAKVVPVHGLCGLWSLIAVAAFQIPGTTAECNLHAAFEGLCFCDLRLPPLDYGERWLAQLFGAAIMIGVSAAGMFLVYGTLYFPPLVLSWMKRVACKKQRVPSEEQSEPDEGGFNFLLTSAEDKRRPLRQLPVLPQPEEDDTQPLLKDRNVHGEDTPRSGTHSLTPTCLNYGAMESDIQPLIGSASADYRPRKRSGGSVIRLQQLPPKHHREELQTGQVGTISGDPEVKVVAGCESSSESDNP